jgi:hypothetical protein
MDKISILLFAALVQGPPVPAATQPIDFYFTNDAVLERGAAAARAEWAAQCVAGGEFADVAGSYAPDPRMGVDARKAQAAKFDRTEFERLATDAWRQANSALPQGPLRVCVDLAAATDAFTRDVMGGVAGVTAGRGRIISLTTWCSKGAPTISRAHCSRTPRHGPRRSMPQPTKRRGARSRSS